MVAINVVVWTAQRMLYKNDSKYLIFTEKITGKITGLENESEKTIMTEFLNLCKRIFHLKITSLTSFHS